MPRALVIVIACSAALLIVVGVTTLGRKDDTHNYGVFTDCARIGTPVVVNDPAGDQRRSEGATIKSAPHGDLMRLRIAKSATQLCTEFQVKGPVVPYVAYVLTMRPQATDTPVAQLEAVVLAGQAPDAMLDLTGTGRNFRKIKAKVGIEGNRLSILVDRRVFVAQGAGALFASFRFQARAAVAAKDAGRLTDCMPVCE